MGLFKSVVDFFNNREENGFIEKPGRNDACWCGSGKKYKKCHLAEDEKKAAHAVYCGKS